MKELAHRLTGAPCAALAVSRYMQLPAQQPPWTSTGVRLRRGQCYTVLGAGLIHWSRRHPHLYGGAGFHLWARVSPGGRVVNMIRNSSSFVADVDGDLELGIYLGMWRDAFGQLDTPAASYARLEGALEVLVLAWQGDSLSGLKALHARCPAPPLSAEIQRLAAPVRVPPEWDYLLETGSSDIYRDCSGAGQPRICLHATDDQGILRKPLDFALTPTTRLSWRWRLDEHPSRVAEDTNATHDYVSIATEFDNGRDLTWIWSSALPIETWFDCPIKAWSSRETHYVTRSGFAAAGQWCSESRAVYDDVVLAMGSPPARIVAVWLICVASFQHGTARASFEKIELHDGEQRLAVL
jgi:Protein of unknown function (DUF3047)